eukprot:TRINITY_DN9530_c0_g1_i1.p1 TRINITY_DN9530_c0_g1~~TRINITY_DN9530_c0_g1_i1.p1  ORF type:complete len:677 (-),score=139.58 TRINITY_DN9530_c0_g1_i1:13-2043(-)
MALQGTVIVSILRANGLKNLDSGASGVSDPFVKIIATAEGKPVFKNQTKVIDNNLNPIWNERFSIILDAPIPQLSVDLQVYDEDVGGCDSLGHYELLITPKTEFEVDQTFTLVPTKKKDKVSGSITVSVSYRSGEQVDLNKKSEKRKKNKKKFNELGQEAKQGIKELRMKRDVLTECEEEKLALIYKIYRSNFGEITCPCFETEKKTLTPIPYKYQRATWVVNSDDISPAKWLRELSDKKGDFVNESKDIVEEICLFQTQKQESFRDGYLNDPEGLFCEELKVWATKELSILAMKEGALAFIQKRIGYLEECLLVSNLFDRPSSLAKGTIQQAIVKVRRILKYRAIANIEKELAHEDASRAFGDLKRALGGLVRSCFKFLNHVFRCETPPGILSAADRLLLTLEGDPNIRAVLGDEINNVKENLKGLSNTGQDAPWQQMDLREKGLRPTKLFLDPAKKDLKDPLLPLLFVGPNSGVEEWFRGNAFIAQKFTRSHGLLLETAKLFVVIEKAANLAKTGGTLLVYGIGNAHLNATLDATKKIMDELKTEFNNVAKIAECCFEELVFANQATKERTEWIKHFKNVFPGMNEINKGIKEIQKLTSEIKHTANSVSLLERFQKAAEEQNDFVSTAEDFSQRIAAVTGTPYVKPVPKEVSPEDSSAWMKLINPTGNPTPAKK